jgi:hypothetical protein
MKNLILFTLILTFVYGCKSDKVNIGKTQSQKANLTPLEVVNMRMNYYNLHDFNQFIKLYADDIKIYSYPDKLLGKGTDNTESIWWVAGGLPKRKSSLIH